MIEITHLTAGYDLRPVLRDVNLHIYRNEFLGIIGPNGGGKTTLIRSILGLIKPFNGSVIFRNSQGQVVSNLSIGYLPQRKNIDTLFPILVEEVVLSGLMQDLGCLKRPTDKQKRAVAEMLDVFGIRTLSKFAIGQLSGGQMQRVMLARAIINSPELLILDEPDSYLDVEFSAKINTILRNLNLSGTTILLVSHKVDALKSLASRIICVEETLKVIS